MESLNLTNLDTIATLGIGAFSRVDLVKVAGCDSESYALKIMKKKHIFGKNQQQHVMNEKNILSSINCTFIVKLYKTFKDRKHLYMLMESCLGGELWTVLRDRKVFDNSTSKFYTCCVLEAFSYLHTRNIIYRDLKPENLLLGETGYLKLVDFGFAKVIESGKKTWTFCGTPEYLAPEIILNEGHDFTADYWSLGILIFELVTGNPPFTASANNITTNLILRGIDAVHFPENIMETAATLIKQLCHNIPSERLGFNGIHDIMNNKWFEDFNWEAFRSFTLCAPTIPMISSPMDVSNFDNVLSNHDEISDDDDVTEDWDKDF
jgi:cGMP-dependent protein kinase